MKHKNKTTNTTHSPKILVVILWESHWLHAVLTLTIYLDSFLTSLFFFVFKSVLLIYYLGMINCIYLTCTVWWALTDVHTCEIPQNISIIFKKFLNEAFAIMPPPPLASGSHCALHVMWFSFPKKFIEMQLYSLWAFVFSFSFKWHFWDSPWCCMCL